MKTFFNKFITVVFALIFLFAAQETEAKTTDMKPLFTMQSVGNHIDGFIQAKFRQQVEILSYLGEEFVNKARQNGEYVDQTGNLRSSIGYIVLNEGKVVQQNFRLAGDGYDRETGKLEAMEFANEKAKEYSEGFVLVCFAGMEYAAAVEAEHGLDVISGSVPGDNEVKSILDKLVA